MDGNATAAAGLTYRLVQVDLHGQEHVLALATVQAAITTTLSRTTDGLSLSLRGVPHSTIVVEVARDVAGPWMRMQPTTLDGSGAGVANVRMDISESARFYRAVMVP